MIRFAYLDAGGIPSGGGIRPSLPAGAVTLGAPYSTDDLPRLMFQAGEWLERPLLPRAEASEFGFHLEGLPDSSAIITIKDCGTGIEDSFPAIAPELWHSLPDDCTVEISVRGPRPWLSSSVTIVRGTGSPELAAQALTRAKVAAQARINAAIGKTRLKYVTDIPGQQTIYTQKQAEAREYLTANPTPVALGDYPLLAAEIGVTAPTAWQLAQVWANKAILFKQVAAITERLRMEASFTIAAATTEAGADAAADAALTTLSEGPL